MGRGAEGLYLRARWAVPISTPPIENAALLIGPDGRIAAVGSRESVSAGEGTPVLDLGEAILLPGLVNVHTHLELTGFEESAAGSDFPSWIAGIRRLKQDRSQEQYNEAARAGLRDCWAGGITTVADTGDSGAVLRILSEMGGGGVVYHEVFGPHPGQVDESFGGLRARVEELQMMAGPRVRVGVSPHALYTVSGPLFSRVAEWAGQEGLPLAVHVAESRAETEFVTRGAGPFAEAWKRRGIPLSPLTTHHSPVSWLHSLGVLSPGALCIHAIQVGDSDVELLRATGSAVAHCPISNARHGHGAAPLAAFRRAGVRVGLGTDSVASVGKLDLFAELRAAQELGGLSDEETLALATIEGARALGLAEETGSLTPGKWADVIAVAPPSHRAPEPPSRRAVRSSPSDVILTVIGGRVAHSALQPGPWPPAPGPW